MDTRTRRIIAGASYAGLRAQAADRLLAAAEDVLASAAPTRRGYTVPARCLARLREAQALYRLIGSARPR